MAKHRALSGAPPPYMTPEHNYLWFLIQAHPGEARCVNRRQILFKMRDRYRDMSDSRMRVLKEHLREAYGKPVGSTLRGWFMCVTAEDYQKTDDFYENKIKDMLRKQKIFKEIRDRLLGPPELPAMPPAQTHARPDGTGIM